MNINMQLLQMIRGQQNPKGLAMNMLQSVAQNNPIANNMLNMIQSGNPQGLEQIARNIVAEQGGDFDTEFNKFKNFLGGKENV